MTEKIKCPCCGSGADAITETRTCRSLLDQDTKLKCMDCLADWYEDLRKPASGWIACSERLPEEDVLVLIYNGKHVLVDILLDDYEAAWDSLEEITHWHPLPEPPVGKVGE